MDNFTFDAMLVKPIDMTKEEENNSLSFITEFTLRINNDYLDIMNTYFYQQYSIN